MKSDFAWLSKSLFCPRSSWPVLLTNGIKPFIKALSSKEMERYHIRLSHTNGENIGLSILAEKDALAELNDKTERHFELFYRRISHFPSAIQGGLYTLIYEESLLNEEYWAREVLSEIMIGNLIGAGLGIEAILSMAFQLHLATAKVFTPYYPNGIDDMVTILAGNTSEETVWNTEKKHIEQSLVLFRAFFGVEESTRYAGRNWLHGWTAMCRTLIERRPDGLQPLHINLATLIDDCFGLENKERALLYYLLEYAFAANSKIGRLGYTSNGNNGQARPGRTDCNKNQLNHYLNVIRTKHILKRMDKSPIGGDKREVRLFTVARNESLRLPFFLQYYFNLGVDRIFLIDNDSTDNSGEIGLQRQNVHVFKITEGYRNHWFWMEYFLSEYGTDHWCMVVDIDELFCFPFVGQLSLKQLISYLDTNDHTAVRSLLLDMYSDRPVIDTVYSQGDNPLDVCRYFDKTYYTRGVNFLDRKKWNYFYACCHFGGVRKRVFGQSEFCLTKFSLFKYSQNVYLVQGMHAISGVQVADIEGAVFHTKYLHDFIEEARVESLREEHFANASEYKVYNNYLSKNSRLSFKNEHSIRFEGNHQLIEMDIMKSSLKFERFLSQSAIAVCP